MSEVKKTKKTNDESNKKVASKKKNVIKKAEQLRKNFLFFSVINKYYKKYKEYLEEYQGEIDIDAFRKYILDNYYPHPPLSEAEVEAIFQEGELFYMDDQYDKAVTCFKKTTLYGHLESLVLLGECYLAGWGVEMNSKLGTELLMKAGLKGSADAYYILGYYSMHGIGDVEQDERRAKKLLKKSSELGNGDASLLLTCYFGWDK